MAKGTIDLRKVSPAGTAGSGGDKRPESMPILPRYIRSAVTKQEPETIEWRALEHEDRERGPYWFLGPGVAALAFVIFGIFAHSYFFIAFVVLAYIVLLMYTRRPPREIDFRVAGDGVHIGAKHYPFAELKSFWIFDAHDHKELSIETGHLLTPYLRIPLGDMDPDRVGHMISRYLPEEEHKEFISDQIARGLGF